MNTLAMKRGNSFGSRHTFAILDGFKQHRILYALAIFCLLSVFVEATFLGASPNIAIVGLFSLPMLMIFLVFVIMGLILETVRLNRSNYQGALVPALWAKLRDRDFSPQRVSNGLHSIVCLGAFMTGFTALKSAIPTANPFSWDQTFADMDRSLHFGAHPYEWLAPLLNSPIVTLALNINYNLWFFVMFGFCFWHCFARLDNRLRQHYLLAFMMTWFVGTPLLGTVFSSVGPGLFGRLYPEVVDPYQPLMAWLQHANQSYTIYALNMMDELWNSYVRGHGAISGLSAMPSMHVGSSILFVLCGFASGKRWLAWIMVAFCAAIFLGSIHLGWHYAIDGYLGAAVAFLCWWGAGKVTSWDRAARGVA